MNELQTLHKRKESTTALSDSLQNVLTSTYGLYLVTHNYHWNVEGLHFISLHALFYDQYNALFLAIDKIAERIRALDSYALPFEDDQILDFLKTTSNAMNKETNAGDRENRMIHNLIQLNENVIKVCQLAKNEARDAMDDETENFMVERITEHQKTLWMLRSIIKNLSL